MNILVSLLTLVDRGIAVLNDRDGGYFSSYIIHKDYVLEVNGEYVDLIQVIEDENNILVLIGPANKENPINVKGPSVLFSARLFKLVDLDSL